MDLSDITNEMVSEFNAQARREHKTRYNALQKLGFMFIDSNLRKISDLSCFLNDGVTDDKYNQDDDDTYILDSLMGRALSVIELIPLSGLHMLAYIGTKYIQLKII